MDFAQFSIMFRSIFMEGLAGPGPGCAVILKNLVPQLQATGRRVAVASGRAADGSRARPRIADHSG